MAKKFRVCLESGSLTQEDKCPITGSNKLSDKYKGKIYILNVTKSNLAEKLDYKFNGKYALKF